MPNCSDRFAIILAAGLSTRMGVCKTTLPWHNNQTLLRYQAEQFLLAGITPIIVLGSHNAYRRSQCPPGSKIVVNFNCQQGKSSSVLTGLNALPAEFSTVIVSAIDQPRSAYIYQKLLQYYRQNKSLIVAPYYGDLMGHPLLFSAQLLPKLKKIEDSTFGVRKVVRELNSKIGKVELTNPEILIDLNDRDAYISEFKTQAIYQNIDNSATLDV